MRLSMVLLAATMLAWPFPALAQVTTSPRPLGPPADTGRPLQELDELTALYNGGEWHDLQKAAQRFLDAAAVDYRTGYVVVVWIGTDSFGKDMLARVVVHAPAAAEPFSADLPGVGTRPGRARVVEAFLSRGPRGRLFSVYVSSRDKEVADALPAFLQAIASPLFAVFGTFAGPVSKAAVKTIGPPLENPPFKLVPPTVHVTVARVGLPFERATIKWKASAKEPVDVDVFSDAIDRFVDDLTFSDVPHSPCARAVAALLGDALKSAAAGARCASATGTSSGCRAHFDELIRAAEAQALDQADPVPACLAPSREDLSAVDRIDDKVRAFAAKSMTTGADADLTFKNRPLTHWSFGAGSGVLTSASLTRPRVAVKSGTVVADPLPRVVTVSFVNWSPAGYDAERDGVSGAERARPFFGATLTPDFGLTAGVNLLLVRGIGVTVGGVLMFSKGADSAEIGKAAANPDKPYSLSSARGILLGVSYSFR